MANNRKKWIINRTFQHHFLIMTIIPLCLLLCFFWLGIEIIFSEMLSYAKEIGLPKNHSFFFFLKDQKTRSLYILCFVSIPSIILYFVWAIVTSHKIAGPLYRLNLYFVQFKDTSKEELPPLSFRKNDYFQEVPKSINSFLQKK